MALIDFTLSNARRFYSSMGNPLGWKVLTENKKIIITFHSWICIIRETTASLYRHIFIHFTFHRRLRWHWVTCYCLRIDWKRLGPARTILNFFLPYMIIQTRFTTFPRWRRGERIWPGFPWRRWNRQMGWWRFKRTTKSRVAMNKWLLIAPSIHPSSVVLSNKVFTPCVWPYIWILRHKICSLLPFLETKTPIKLTQPVVQCISLFRGECRMNYSKWQKLSTFFLMNRVLHRVMQNFWK